MHEWCISFLQSMNDICSMCRAVEDLLIFHWNWYLDLNWLKESKIIRIFAYLLVTIILESAKQIAVIPGSYTWAHRKGGL